jgi:citrate lyase subunit beta / citryl-CoA lyase
VSLLVLRSALYVPGSRPELFEKALAGEADAVIVDLEDAVTPSRKAEARAAAAQLVASRHAKPVFVRVNGVPSSSVEDDVAALVGPGLAGIRLPKVESASEVAFVAGLLAAVGMNTGVWCLIESALGLERSFEIASAEGTEGIALGEADLRASLRADDAGLEYARSRCVAAARAAGLPSPLQSVYADVRDLEGLRRSCERGKALGFFGRAAVHPSQVGTINDVFTPTEREVEAARELTRALDDALLDDIGAVALPDGRFVDRAVAEQARETVALAERLEGTRL